MIVSIIMTAIVLVILLSAGNWFLNQQKSETAEDIREISSADSHDFAKSLNYDGEITKDLRLHYYNCVQLSSKLGAGDYVDIRISFANGVDFIVLPKKKIADLAVSNVMEGRNQSSLWLYVNEEEILRMSSAMVDYNLQVGSLIYAAKYVEDSQGSADANYPVNDVVRKLLDDCPNIENRGKFLVESPLRKEIEESGEYINQPAKKTEEPTYYSNSTENAIQENNILYEEGEVIYLD